MPLGETWLQETWILRCVLISFFFVCVPTSLTFKTLRHEQFDFLAGCCSIYSSSGTLRCVVAVRSFWSIEWLRCLHLQLKTVQAESKHYTTIHKHTNTNTHTHKHTNTHTNTHTQTHTHTNAHTQTHTNAHTHATKSIFSSLLPELIFGSFAVNVRFYSDWASRKSL